MDNGRWTTDHSRQKNYKSGVLKYIVWAKMMAFKFENLRVWQSSHEFAEKINSIADQFPKKELFNLSTQIRRAADSIGLNIVEGSTGQSNAEQKRFLIFANRSALEVVACLFKARLRKYIDEITFTDLYSESEKLIKMIQAFIKNSMDKSVVHRPSSIVKPKT